MRVVETVPSNMPAPSPNITLNSNVNTTNLQTVQAATLTQHDMKDGTTNTLTTITSNDAQSKKHTECQIYSILIADLSEPLPVSAPVQQQAVVLQPPLIRQASPATQSAPNVTVNNCQSPIKTETVKVETPTTPAATQMSLKQTQQQIAQENEQFALAWLRATFEPVMALTSRIEQSDLYKMYNTASSKIGRQSVVSMVHFPRCVRTVFGGTVGPNKIKISNVDTMCYEGIRIRAKPLAVVHKGTILVISSKIFLNGEESTELSYFCSKVRSPMRLRLRNKSLRQL